MKKISKILFVLLVMSVFGFSLVLSANAATNAIGDVDGDGSIAAADARLALRASVGLEKLTDAQFKSADVNNDNTVTSSDARTILRVSVGLEKFEDGVQAEMSKVNKEIQKFLNDDMYKNLKTVEERKDAIEDLLFNMADDGLINEKSIKYYEDTGMYYFEYTSGISSGIYVKPIFNNNLGGTINNNTYTEAPSNVSITQKNIDILSVQHTWNDSIMLYGWDNITKADSHYSKWQETVDNCNNRNMNMTLYYAPRVQDYKSILLKKDFICIAEHGAKYPKDENNFIYCFAVYGENITDDKNDGIYAQDIAKNRIIPVYDGTIQEATLSEQKGFYLITPDFFRHFYGDKSLNDSIVYLSSCMGFGESSNVDNYFAEIFVEECGAKAVIGFCNSVWLDYANEFLDVFTSYISSGGSIRKALNDTISFCGASDKEYVELFGDVDSYSIDKLGMLPAVPVLFEQKNKVTGTVTDSKTGSPIPNVIIELIDNEIDSFDPVVTTTTDSNGKYSLEVPYGSYSISYTHKEYETVGISLSVEFEAYEKNISLMPCTEKAKVFGTVQDKNTNEVIPYVTIQLINSENVPVWTDITNENGEFVFDEKIPYGTYTIKFTHDNYATSEYTIVIDAEEVEITELLVSGDARPVTASGNCGADGDNVKWTLYEDGELVISGSGDMTDYSSPGSVPWYSYRELITEVTIKDTITSIGIYAFYDYPILDSISLPDSLIYIGDNAFAWCISLNNIILPNKITKIGSYTFYNCTNLTSISLPDNLKEIDKRAFENCTSLISVIFPKHLTSIGELAFFNCKSLMNIKLPEKLTNIGVRAFEFCANLTSVNLPQSLKSIGNYAFGSCIRLERINIPDGITNIGEGVFYDCILKTINIPNNVTSIDNYAFTHNSELTDVYYSGTKEEWGKITIGKHNEDLTNATIHYNS